MKTDIVLQIIKLRWLQHILFWGIAFYLLLHLFSGPSETHSIDWLYTGVFLFTVAVGVYINLLVLIPVFLSHRKYFLYLLLLCITITASAELNILAFSRYHDFLFPGYYFISDYGFTDVIKIVIAFTLLTSLLKFSKGWFLLAEAKTRMEKLQKEQLETELKVLKSQINPHFLFNSLNNIYALVIKKSDQAPGAILKLSGFMRYILYETSGEYVALDTELTYLQDYTDLQKLRAGKDANIRFSVEGNPARKKIAPLLLLPLVENSFKHGIKGETGPSFVNAELHIGDRTMEFSIENNIGETDPVEKKDSGGIGLDNLKQRLDRLYPDNHSISINDSGGIFSVKLIVPLLNELEMPGR